MSRMRLSADRLPAAERTPEDAEYLRRRAWVEFGIISGINPDELPDADWAIAMALRNWANGRFGKRKNDVDKGP